MVRPGRRRSPRRPPGGADQGTTGGTRQRRRTGPAVRRRLRSRTPSGCLGRSTGPRSGRRDPPHRPYGPPRGGRWCGPAAVKVAHRSRVSSMVPAGEQVTDTVAPVRQTGRLVGDVLEWDQLEAHTLQQAAMDCPVGSGRLRAPGGARILPCQLSPTISPFSSMSIPAAAGVRPMARHGSHVTTDRIDETSAYRGSGLTYRKCPPRGCPL